MALTAADILLNTIQRWGVEVIFGLPGDGIAGIMQAIERTRGKVRFIQVRHEEAAAFMASGYARFTGKLGVCLGSSGSGGIHLLNGLYDAKLDGQPVLALTGTQHHALIDTYSQQDVALDRLFMDVAIYNTRIMGPEHVENVVNLACRAALTEHGVAHITFPIDIQKYPLKSERAARGASNTVSFARRARLPYEGDLRKAAQVLNEGKKVAILVGRGGLGAASELELIAEILGAPIIKALMGKSAVGDDSPYTTGSTGPLGTRPSLEALQACDTLLLVGTSFPYSDYLPRPGSARAIQIDIDPTRIGLRYPVEVGLVGDSQRTLKELLPHLTHRSARPFLEKAQKNMKAWRLMIEKEGSRQDLPLKPQVVAYQLGKLLTEDAVVACDAGSTWGWWARFLMAHEGQFHAISGNLGAAGSALSYAIAAQVADSKRQCIAFCGDGGFSMLMADFATCVKYNLPVKVVILKNQRPDAVANPPVISAQDSIYALQPIDYAAFARASGGLGFTIDSLDECVPILTEALASPGPVIVEACVDPEESLEPIVLAEKKAPPPEKDSLRDLDLALISEKVREMIQGMADRSEKD